MTVEIYIPKENKRDAGFQHTFERSAAIDVAHRFYQVYHGDAESLYALVFNINEPPADLVVMTANGIGVVDFKHINGVLRGDIDNPWTITGKDGKFIRRIEMSDKFANPFHQVKDYRLRIFKGLRQFAGSLWGKSMPDWMRGTGKFHLQGAVAFTSDHGEVALTLDPDATTPWFETIEISQLPQWAYTLTFANQGQQHSLTPDQIRMLAKLYFRAGEWESVQGLIDGATIYGYLSVYEGDGSQRRHPLSSAKVTLGRGHDNDIIFGSGGVSRQHAQIVRDGNEVHIEDLGSTNGTFVNGAKLETNKRRRLKEGDMIVFGPMTADGPAHDARRATYHTNAPNPTATNLYRVPPNL